MSNENEKSPYGRVRRSQEAIREPLQERSRKNMDRIMESLEGMLEEMPFDRITMAELARRSGVGTSSIYARFADKRALILGVHMRLREKTLGCLDVLANPSAWHETSLEDKVRRILLQVVRFYRKHRFVVRAALFVDDPEVRERQASVLRAAEEKFTQLFPVSEPKAKKNLEEAVEAAVRIVASVMYAELIFGEVELVRKPVSERVLVEQLSTAVIALLLESGAGRRF